jgi:hypothetical protein
MAMTPLPAVPESHAADGVEEDAENEASADADEQYFYAEMAAHA